MRRSSRALACTALGLALLGDATAAASAEKYFGYAERNVEVTAAGTDAYAVDLARSCLRLDAMLTHILGVTTSYRVPTYIYGLPHDLMQRYDPGDFRSGYRVSRFGVAVIFDTSALSNGRDYSAAYFGYVAALLASSDELAGPYWYRIGVPEVFSDVLFDGPHARLGGITPSRARTLMRAGSLIPMRTFLKLSKQQEEQGSYFPQLYGAEAWYLAREIFVEGLHRAEFNQYLGMLRAGSTEKAAFAASFHVSYEDLDKELAWNMHQLGHSYVVDLSEPGTAAVSTARAALSPAEVQARLALLSVRYGRGPDAIPLAEEALRTEPANESALRALALGHLVKKAWPEALAAVDRLPASLSSAAAYGDRADVLMVVSAQPEEAADAAKLRTRAGQDYQAALSAAPDDRRAQQGLMRLGAAH